MTVRIIAATLRDLTYILANLRPEDREEIACQLDEWDGPIIAAACLYGGNAYVAMIDGNPEAAFGVGMVRQGYGIAWAWGSKRFVRAAPKMTKFIRTIIIPDLYAAGAHRVEARSISTHTQAHRWLEKLGANRRCDLPGHGKDGEDFILFDWTRRDVPVQHENSEAATDPADTSAGQ